MYPRSQERRRNREATVYLPALGGDGPSSPWWKQVLSNGGVYSEDTGDSAGI